MHSNRRQPLFFVAYLARGPVSTRGRASPGPLVPPQPADNLVLGVVMADMSEGEQRAMRRRTVLLQLCGCGGGSWEEKQRRKDSALLFYSTKWWRQIKLGFLHS
jgi:hypothetical protein